MICEYKKKYGSCSDACIDCQATDGCEYSSVRREKKVDWMNVVCLSAGIVIALAVAFL